MTNSKTHFYTHTQKQNQLECILSSAIHFWQKSNTALHLILKSNEWIKLTHWTSKGSITFFWVGNKMRDYWGTSPLKISYVQQVEDTDKQREEHLLKHKFCFEIPVEFISNFASKFSGLLNFFSSWQVWICKTLSSVTAHCTSHRRPLQCFGIVWHEQVSGDLDHCTDQFFFSKNNNNKKPRGHFKAISFKFRLDLSYPFSNRKFKFM